MKKIFEKCTEIYTKHDELSGCTFIIAIDICYGDKGNGGTRMLNYETVEEGEEDAIELSRAMTKKCLIIGSEYNGGYTGAKGVIVGDPAKQKTPDMLRRYGKFVESFHGKFQTGTDMNITLEDIAYMAEESQYIDGLSDGLGDTAIPTALGVLTAMKSTLKWYEGETLEEKTIAVQGVGSVGSDLIRRLIEEKAIVIATDINEQKLLKAKNDFGIQIVKPDEIYSVQCDIFSPNAIGKILNNKTIPMLNCNYVIGSANNQLAEDLVSVKLMEEKKVVYLPDFVINIGGVFLSMCEVQGKDIEYVNKNLKYIINKRLKQIFSLAEKSKISLLEAANLVIDFK